MDTVTWYFTNNWEGLPIRRGAYFTIHTLREIYINPVGCDMNFDTIAGTIAHEVIHAVLHREESLETCRAFDNIAYSTNSSIAFDRYLNSHLPFIQLRFI